LQSKGIWTATARAGNVIGGGDWSKDRLIPDLWRAFEGGEALEIRSPSSTRPWQHVLEPLSGYLELCRALVVEGEAFQGAWNFGPGANGIQTVAWLSDELCRHLPGLSWHAGEEGNLHEAKTLSLDSSKARDLLRWQPKWDTKLALEITADWFLSYRAGSDMYQVTTGQIRNYSE
jgi:CDP-glucose 4,6-dehydratase